MKIRYSMPGLLIMLLMSGMAGAQQEKNDAAEVVGSLPYEVIVRPRVTRAHLRELITKVEDDFFAKFNELNIDDAYDIACYKHTPIMSHISERVCEPWFVLNTRNLNSTEVTMFLGNAGKGVAGSERSAYLLTPRALNRETSSDYEILQEKMEELTRSSPEFRSIGNALAELKARLEKFGDE